MRICSAEFGDRNIETTCSCCERASAASYGRWEMIGRSLKSFHNEGIIRLDGQRIVITDGDALSDIAGVEHMKRNYRSN
jgi:hypothetical protein